MIQEYLSIIGTQIHQHNNGNILAVLKDVIINTDTGKIEAIWVKPLTVHLSNAVIRTSDIIEWKKRIYIKGDTAISDPEDIIRISEILARNILVIDSRVENQQGDYLGDVYSFDFDSESMMLRFIYTEKKALGLISHQKGLFSYKNIIEIKESVIIVDDKTLVKDEVTEAGVIEDSPASAVT